MKRGVFLNGQNREENVAIPLLSLFSLQSYPQLSIFFFLSSIKYIRKENVINLLYLTKTFS